MLYAGEPATGLRDAMAAVGLSLHAVAAADAAVAARTLGPATVIVDRQGADEATTWELVAAAHAQRFVQPCVVIGEGLVRDAVTEADLVVPPTIAPTELARRVRHMLDTQPLRILRDHRRLIATLPKAACLIESSGRVAGMSAAAERLFATTAASAVGQTWQKLIGGKGAEKFRWLFTTRRTGDRAESGVIQVVLPSAVVRKVECCASGLWAGAPDLGGLFVGTIVLCSDVTAAQQIDTQLIQATKLEAMGHLAGGIAHDFNNLLSVILGSAQLLRHDYPEHPGIDDLREIETAGTQAAQMTKQLLMFSREQEPETTTFDVAPMIIASSKMLKRLLGEQVRIELQLADGTMGVRADAGQLEQVLVNLAVNARDAMPNGGRLSIRAEAVELRRGSVLPTDAAEGTWVQIVVEDEGQGMSAEILEKIFEPFFTTKGREQGTGLGLSVVYGIVKRHGGHIHVTSTPGKGTRFYVLFPQVSELVSKPAAKRSVMHAGGERILLVEDDDMVRRYLTRTLEGHGYSVLPVHDGPTALAVAPSFEQLDLLVTDIGLPGISGTELSARLRTRFPKLPVIYISGHIDLAADARLGEAETFVAKPVNASQILASIRHALDRANAR